MQIQSVKGQFGKDRTIQNFQACATKLGFEKVGQFQLETKDSDDTSEKKNQVFVYARRDGAILTFDTAEGTYFNPTRGTHLNYLKLSFEIPDADFKKVWNAHVSSGGWSKTADGSSVYQGEFATYANNKGEAWLEQSLQLISTLGKIQKFSQPSFESEHCFIVEQDYSNQKELFPDDKGDLDALSKRIEQVQAQRLGAMPAWVQELVSAGNLKPAKTAEPQPPQNF